MYKYNSGKKYTANKIYEDKEKSNYIKSYNINIETMGTGAIKRMQNKIGNEATEELLSYMGKVALGQDGEKSVSMTGDKSSGYGRDTEIVQKMSKDFRDIIGEQKSIHSDTVNNHIGIQTKDDANRLKFKESEISFILLNLQETATALKLLDLKGQNREMEIMLGDKMLSPKHKETVYAADSILDLIKGLKKYDPSSDERTKYISVINMLVSTGIDLIRFLSLSGNVYEQKMMLYRAFGVFDTNDEVQNTN